MFCSKCGKAIKTNVCEYCGTSDKVYHSNNYIKSPEMYELLIDDKDFSCVKENDISEIHEELQTSETPDKNITEQVTEDTFKKISEDDTASKENNTEIKKHTYITNKGKNIIIAVLCIIIAGVSTAYTVLLKKYNNIAEINNNAVLHNPENSVVPVKTEADKATEITIITESTMSLSPETQTSVVTEVVGNATDNITQERNNRTEILFKNVKNQKYNDIQIDEILSLYENKQPIMYFDNSFNYEDVQKEYEIDSAEECINGNNKWDSSVNCGELSYTDTKNHKKLMYYFMEQNTYGKQYVLTDENNAPDIDDIIYIEPVENSVNRCYYMARYCNNNSSMYIIIDNNVYDFVEFEAKTNSSTEQYEYPVEYLTSVSQETDITSGVH